MKLTNKGLVEYVKSIERDQKTVYMWGTFGQEVTKKCIQDKAKQYPHWYTSAKVNKFKSLVEQGVYAFDCVGLIKSYCWGGINNLKYSSKQDLSANKMFEESQKCGQIGTIPEIPGVLVWMSGHIGVYVGNQEVIECTPRWKSGVQKTRLSQRKWQGWCECLFIDYTEEEKVVDEPSMWAKESCEKAKKNGVIKGDGKGYYGWKESVSLERVAVLLDNLKLLD